MERASTITYLKGETIGTDPEGKGKGGVCHHGLLNPWLRFPSKAKASPQNV